MYSYIAIINVLTKGVSSREGIPYQKRKCNNSSEEYILIENSISSKNLSPSQVLVRCSYH